jgi:hypothetical protein
MELNVEVMKKKKSPKSKSRIAKSSKESDDSHERFSPIPKHLSPEERKKWEKDIKWEREEVERRKKEGLYPKNANGKRAKAKMKKSSSEDRTLHDTYY